MNECARTGIRDAAVALEGDSKLNPTFRILGSRHGTADYKQINILQITLQNNNFTCVAVTYPPRGFLAIFGIFMKCDTAPSRDTARKTASLVRTGRSSWLAQNGSRQVERDAKKVDAESGYR